MSVSCQCGDEFPRHPALEIECPECHAPVGRFCKRPSEHGVFRDANGWALHGRRKKAAFAAKPCSCLRLWEERQRGSRVQRELFAEEAAA